MTQMKGVGAKLHPLTLNNRELIQAAGSASCISCGETVAADAIVAFVDGSTSVCPNCGADALLPLTTPELAKMLHKEWFS